MTRPPSRGGRAVRLIRRCGPSLLTAATLLAGVTSGCGAAQQPVTIAPADNGWRVDVDELGVSWRFVADPRAIIGAGTRPDQSAIDVIRLSATNGEVLWRTEVVGAAPGTLTNPWVFNGAIVVHANDRLVGLDLSNGNTLWSLEVPFLQSITSAQALGGSLVLASSDQTVHVVSARSGNRTITTMPDNSAPPLFARYGGSIYALTSMVQTSEQAFGRVNGGAFSPAWTAPVSGNAQRLQIDGSVVSIIMPNGEVLGFDRSSGEAEASSVYSAHPEFAFGTHQLSWTTRAGRFLRFQDFSATEFGTGEPTWTTPTTIVSAPSTMSAYPVHDLLLVATGSPSFLLFREDGTLIWTATLQRDPAESCSNIGTDGMHVISQCTGFAESYLQAYPTESGR